MSNTSTISMIEKAFWNTEVKEADIMQSKMDSITSSLTSEQVQSLKEVIDWVAYQKSCEDSYERRYLDDMHR